MNTREGSEIQAVTYQRRRTVGRTGNNRDNFGGGGDSNRMMMIVYV